MEKDNGIKCAHCGLPLGREHTGPCPSCEKTGLSFTPNNSGASFGISCSSYYQFIITFYEKNIPLMTIYLVLMLSPIAYSDIKGIIVGIVINIISTIIGFYAILRVVNISHN